MRFWRRSVRSPNGSVKVAVADESVDSRRKAVFATPQWIDAANAIASDGGLTSPKRVSAVLDLVFTDQPDGVPDTVNLRMHKGRVSFGVGHDPEAMALVYTPYALFKEQILSGDYRAAHAAHRLGQIKVEGDLAELASLGQMSRTSAFQERLEAITV